VDVIINSAIETVNIDKRKEGYCSVIMALPFTDLLTEYSVAEVIISQAMRD